MKTRALWAVAPQDGQWYQAEVQCDRVAVRGMQGQGTGVYERGKTGGAGRGNPLGLGRASRGTGGYIARSMASMEWDQAQIRGLCRH